MTARSDLAIFVGYLSGLPGFLRRPLTEEEAGPRLERRLARRADALLELVDRAVLARAGSPYARLLRHAGIERGDLARLLRDEGVEGALEGLFDAGVRLTIDEFKGKSPIRRGSLELAVEAVDFDNPLLVKRFEASTGGSGGAARPIVGNFELLEEFALYQTVLNRAFDLPGRPLAVWQPLPPSIAGIASALVTAKQARPIARWFSQTRFEPSAAGLRAALTVSTAYAACRIWGAPFAFPRHVPPDRADRVARWLEQQIHSGKSPALQSTPSSAVRVCVAAAELGIDLAGSLFLFGGEPYTEAKARIVAESGCRGMSPYGMSELGWVGMPCAAPSAVDDVHLIRDKVAVVARPKSFLSGEVVDALHFTELQGGAPKVMLNVESGDYGVLEPRPCGCAVEAAGYAGHLHTIRSYEKLTSEGMTFLGTDLLTLVEDVLPTRFGGAPTDYQLVEEERDGLSRVMLYVNPRVGALDEQAVVRVVLDFLRAGSRHEAMMAEIWRAAETLRLVRAAPHVTPASKVQPLHVVRTGSR